MQLVKCSNTKVYKDGDNSLTINKPVFAWDNVWRRPTYQGQVIRDVQQSYDTDGYV